MPLNVGPPGGLNLLRVFNHFQCGWGIFIHQSLQMSVTLDLFFCFMSLLNRWDQILGKADICIQLSLIPMFIHKAPIGLRCVIQSPTAMVEEVLQICADIYSLTLKCQLQLIISPITHHSFVFPWLLCTVLSVTFISQFTDEQCSYKCDEFLMNNCAHLENLKTESLK